MNTEEKCCGTESIGSLRSATEQVGYVVARLEKLQCEIRAGLNQIKETTEEAIPCRVSGTGVGVAVGIEERLDLLITKLDYVEGLLQQDMQKLYSLVH